MSIEEYIPERITRRYSMRITVALVGVLLVTVLLGAVIMAHVGADLGPASEERFVEDTEDRAVTVGLWLTAHTDRAEGLAGSEAVASGDHDRIEERFTGAVDTRSDELVEIHYVDGSGDVLASSSSDAVGANFLDASGENGFADEPTRTGVHDALAHDEQVLTFVAPAEDDRYVAVSASTDTLATYLESDGRTVLADGGQPLVGVGQASVSDEEMLANAPDEFGAIQPDGAENEYAATTATVDEGLTLVTYADSNVVYNSQNMATAGVAALLLVFTVHLGLVGIVLGGNASLSLRQLADRAERLGSGEFDVELEADRGDEIGALYEAFAEMRDSLQETLEEVEEQRERAREAHEETERRNEELIAEAERFSVEMTACADGDLTRRLDPETEIEAMHEIAGAFNEMIDDLEATVADVTAFADRVTTASTELQTSAGEIRRVSESVSGSIQEISEGATRQSEDLEIATTEINDLSATVEEVASTTGSIAEQSSRVAALSESGRDAAETATDEIEEAVDRTASVSRTVQTLNQETEQIGEIVGLIDDIARQTDILALNAAIEAAQLQQATGGGESGFDVVADEVKNLAEETQEAVREVEDSLQAIQAQAQQSADEVERTEERIQSAAAAVDQMRVQFDDVAEGIQQVDRGIDEIDDATDDQASSTQDLATIVEDVASVAAETAEQAESVAASSEEATATISEVSAETQQLDARANQLAEALSVFTVSNGADPRREVAPAQGGDE